MTTLPQTTTMRLPRPNGAQVLAHPGAGPSIAIGGGQAGFQMTGGDVWRVIRANIWLIIGMVMLSGIAGVGLYIWLAHSHPKFTATGLQRIDPPVPITLKQTDRAFIDTTNRETVALEQRTQAQLLKQDQLMSEVLQKSDAVRSTEWFAQFNGDMDKAKDDLRDNFGVSPIPDTRLIMLSMTCTSPKDAKIIVDEVGNQHLKNQQELSRNKQYERSKTLTATMNRYKIRLGEVQQELREKAVRLSIDGMGVPGRLSSKEVELSGLIKEQMETESQAAMAKSALESTEKSLQEGRDPPFVEETVNKDLLVLDYQRQLDQAQAALRAAENRVSPDHNAARMWESQIEVWQRKLEDRKAEARAQARVMLQDQMRSQLSALQERLDALNKRVQAAKDDFGEMSKAMETYLLRKDEEKDLLDNIKSLDEQLEIIAQTQSSQDLSGLLWAMRPEIPDKMSFPRLVIILPMAILLGLGLSLGIAFLREMTDTRVRSPRDIAKVGQMNMLGMIPHTEDDPQAVGARLPLVIFDAPHSMTAEQFRQVRARLQHAASLDSTRSILVTSPSPDDGKTIIACNLAAGLALNGRRILLVDANFRRPQLHKIFEITNEVGLSDALASLDNFEAGVRETAVPNLSIMTSGPKPGNTTELLESQLLVDFIERALEEYDHVIFDSGPMLFVSETVALAPRVDGVVTVVRARTNTRGLLQRMRDALRQVKAEHLGIVLNGVHAQAGGYYGRNIKTYYEYQNGHVAS